MEKILQCLLSPKHCNSLGIGGCKVAHDFLHPHTSVRARPCAYREMLYVAMRSVPLSSVHFLDPDLGYPTASDGSGFRV